MKIEYKKITGAVFSTSSYLGGFMASCVYWDNEEESSGTVGYAGTAILGVSITSS